MNKEVYYIKEYSIYIPLWHEEIVYNNVYVYINPQLPDNMYIDADNNIHVFEYARFPLHIDVGGVSFLIEETTEKIVEFKEQGIPIINKNIYDISVLSDVIIHLHFIPSS